MSTSSFQPMGIIWPDVTSDTVLYLRPLLDPSIRVCINLTDWRRPQPCVQIHRRGGRGQGLLDMANLQVDVRHEDWDTTSDLTSLVRAFLADMPNHIPEVKRVTENSGPSWFPDTDGGARFMFGVDIAVSGTQIT